MSRSRPQAQPFGRSHFQCHHKMEGKRSLRGSDFSAARRPCEDRVNSTLLYRYPRSTRPENNPIMVPAATSSPRLAKTPPTSCTQLPEPSVMSLLRDSAPSALLLRLSLAAAQGDHQPVPTDESVEVADSGEEAPAGQGCCAKVSHARLACIARSLPDSGRCRGSTSASTRARSRTTATPTATTTPATPCAASSSAPSGSSWSSCSWLSGRRGCVNISSALLTPARRR